MKINWKNFIRDAGIYLLFFIFLILSFTLPLDDIFKVIAVWAVIVWSAYLYVRVSMWKLTK